MLPSMACKFNLARVPAARLKQLRLYTELLLSLPERLCRLRDATSFTYINVETAQVNVGECIRTENSAFQRKIMERLPVHGMLLHVSI